MTPAACILLRISLFLLNSDRRCNEANLSIRADTHRQGASFCTAQTAHRTLHPSLGTRQATWAVRQRDVQYSARLLVAPHARRCLLTAVRSAAAPTARPYLVPRQQYGSQKLAPYPCCLPAHLRQQAWRQDQTPGYPAVLAAAS